MPVLPNIRHEQFAQALASGLNATNAYISAGYKKAGAAQNAARLIKVDKVCARVKELRTTIAAGVIQLEISSKNARVQALQDLFDRARQVIDARAKDKTMAGVPGGATGLLVRDYKGKNAGAPVYRVDTALIAELRALMRQAAEELGQWVEKSENNTLSLKELAERLNAGRSSGTGGNPAIASRVRRRWRRRQWRHHRPAGPRLQGKNVGAVPDYLCAAWGSWRGLASLPFSSLAACGRGPFPEKFVTTFRLAVTPVLDLHPARLFRRV